MLSKPLCAVQKQCLGDTKYHADLWLEQYPYVLFVIGGSLGVYLRPAGESLGLDVLISLPLRPGGHKNADARFYKPRFPLLTRFINISGTRRRMPVELIFLCSRTRYYHLARAVLSRLRKLSKTNCLVTRQPCSSSRSDPKSTPEQHLIYCQSQREVGLFPDMI